jgi:hypothetical protein
MRKGKEPTTRAAAIMEAHVAAGNGFRDTTRIEVSTATGVATLRSSSSGNENSCLALKEQKRLNMTKKLAKNI